MRGNSNRNQGKETVGEKEEEKKANIKDQEERAWKEQRKDWGRTAEREGGEGGGARGGRNDLESKWGEQRGRKSGEGDGKGKKGVRVGSDGVQSSNLGVF